MSGPETMLAETEVAPHEHLVYIYDGTADLKEALGRFIAAGRAQNDLVVFVHSFDDDAEATTFVEEAAPDAAALRHEKLLVVRAHTAAFEGNARRIDRNHVAEVLSGLIDQAEASDCIGARIFVDASRQYFAESRATEWLNFEAWLGRRLNARAALVCAYRREDIRDLTVLDAVLRAHRARFAKPRRAATQP